MCCNQNASAVHGYFRSSYIQLKYHFLSVVLINMELRPWWRGPELKKLPYLLYAKLLDEFHTMAIKGETNNCKILHY